MKILSVNLNQFHDKAGFQIVARYPLESALTTKQFQLYSDLILPRQQLCDRILAIEFNNEYFLVVKALLSKNKQKDSTYFRQMYIYSVSILVRKVDYLDKIKQPIYKQAVSKLAMFFKTIQEAKHIVYFNPKHLTYLNDILQIFFNDINQKGSCDLTYMCDYFSFINAKYPKLVQQSIKINQSSVPVTLLNQKQIQKIQNSLAKQLLKYAYDGTFCIKKICKLHRDRKQSQIKQFFIKSAEKGLVFILDLINLQNIYILNDKILDYLPNQSKNNDLNNIARAISKNNNKINTYQLLSVYLQCNRVTTLAKLIQVNRSFFSSIIISKFIRMGQIYGFLSRSHQKLIYNSSVSQEISIQAFRKALKQKNKQLKDINERILDQQAIKFKQTLKVAVSNNYTIDQILTIIQMDYERFTSIIQNQNWFILQISENN